MNASVMATEISFVTEGAKYLFFFERLCFCCFIFFYLHSHSKDLNGWHLCISFESQHFSCPAVYSFRSHQKPSCSFLDSFLKTFPFLFSHFQMPTWPYYGNQNPGNDSQRQISSVCAKLCPILCESMDCSPPGSLSRGFSKLEYCSGLPCPTPGDLHDLGIKCTSPEAPASQADSLPLSHGGSPKGRLRFLSAVVEQQ